MDLLSIQNANANVSLKDIFEGLSSHVEICGKCGFSSSRVLQTLRKVRINRAKLAGVATSAFRLQAGIGFIRFRNCIKKDTSTAFMHAFWTSAVPRGGVQPAGCLDKTVKPPIAAPQC